MNKIYKVIWSKVRNCYVAVSEIAKRNGKSCTSVNCGAKANRGHAGVALAIALSLSLAGGGVAWGAEVNNTTLVEINGNQENETYILNYSGGSTAGTGANITVNSGGKIHHINSSYSGNTVIINSGGQVLGTAGSIGDGGIVAGINNNRITVRGYVADSIFGGYNVSGDVSGNIVTIEGGTVGTGNDPNGDNVYGGKSSKSGASVTNNKVIINGGTVYGYVEGGDAWSNEDNVDNNYVELNGATITKGVSGGGTSYNNTLTLSGAGNTVGGQVSGFKTIEISSSLGWAPGSTVLSARFTSSVKFTLDISGATNLKNANNTYGTMTLLAHNRYNNNDTFFDTNGLKLKYATASDEVTLNSTKPKQVVRTGSSQTESNFTNGVKLTYNQKEHIVSLDSAHNYNNVLYTVADNVTGISFDKMTWGTGRDLSQATHHYDFSNATTINASNLTFAKLDEGELGLSSPSIKNGTEMSLLTNATGITAGNSITPPTTGKGTVPIQFTRGGMLIDATAKGTVSAGTDVVKYVVDEVKVGKLTLGETDWSTTYGLTLGTWGWTLADDIVIDATNMTYKKTYSTKKVNDEHSVVILYTSGDVSINDIRMPSSGKVAVPNTVNSDSAITFDATAYGDIIVEEKTVKTKITSVALDKVTLGTYSWGTSKDMPDTSWTASVSTTIDDTNFAYTGNANTKLKQNDTAVILNATGLTTSSSVIRDTGASATKTVGMNFTDNGTGGSGFNFVGTANGHVAAAADKVNYVVDSVTLNNINLASWNGSNFSLKDSDWGWSLATSGGAITATVDTGTGTNTMMPPSGLNPGQTQPIVTATGLNFTGIEITGDYVWGEGTDLEDNLTVGGVTIGGKQTKSGVKVNEANTSQLVYEQSKKKINTLTLGNNITFANDDNTSSTVARTFDENYDLTTASIDTNALAFTNSEIMEEGNSMRIVDASAAIKDGSGHALKAFTSETKTSFDVGYTDSIAGKGLTFTGTHTDTLSQDTNLTKIIYTVGNKKASAATLTGAITWDTSQPYYENTKYTFNTDATTNLDGLSIGTVSADPYGQSMTLIKGKVKGTVTNAPASFGASVNKTYTTLGATAAGSAAITSSGDLTYSVDGVRLDTITVNSVGDTYDTVPANWTLKSGATVDASGMTVPSGLSVGEKKPIIVQTASGITDYFAGVTFTDGNKWTKGSDLPTTLTTINGVSVTGTQTTGGVKVDELDKNRIIYESSKKNVTAITLGTVPEFKYDGTAARTFDSEYDVSTATITATNFKFADTSPMEAGDAMTIVDATSAISYPASGPKLTAFDTITYSNVAFADTITDPTHSSTADNIKFTGQHTDTLSQDTAKTKLTYTVGDKVVDTATLSGPIAWSDGGTYYTNGTAVNQKGRNSVFTFDSSNSKIDISGVRFSATTDPLNKTMTLISGNTISGVAKNVAGTITNGSPASFGISLAKNNTTLKAKATNGEAKITSGNLTYTVKGVAMDTIDVTSVANATDTVPANWVLASGASVETDNLVIAASTGLAPGETKAIITSTVDNYFNGVSVNGSHAWQVDGGDITADLDIGGVGITGTQTKGGVKVNEANKSQIIYEESKKKINTLTLGKVTFKNDDGTVSTVARSFDATYDVSTATISAGALSFSNAEVMETGNTMRIVDASAALPNAVTGKKMPVFTAQDYTVNYIDTISGKVITFAGTHTDTLAQDAAQTKLTYTVGDKNVSTATLNGAVNWSDGVSYYTNGSDVNQNNVAATYKFDGNTSVDISNVSFSATADPLAGATKTMTLLKGVNGVAAGKVSGTPSFAVTLDQSNTKLDAKATGAAAVSGNDVTYTVSGVAIDKVNIKSVGSTADTVPANWTLATGASVETDAMTTPSGMNPGETRAIITATGTDYFNGIAINGSHAWKVDGSTLTADLEVGGVTVAGTQTQSGVKVDETNKKQLVYEETKKKLTSITLGEATFANGGTARTFDNTYDATTASINGDGLKFTEASRAKMETGNTMTILDATAAIKNASNETLATFNGGASKSYGSIDFTDTFTGKNIKFVGTHTDTLAQDTAKTKLTYTVGDKNVSTATLSGAINWNDSGVHYTNGSDANQNGVAASYKFDGNSAVDVSRVSFSATADPLAGATKSMTLLKGVNGVAAGKVSGTPAFGVTLDQANTKLDAKATGAATVSGNDVTYTVSGVAIDKVNVKSVGSTADTVPTNWTLATGASVETDAMTTPSGMNPGETRAIITATGTDYFNGIAINGSHAWKLDGSALSATPENGVAVAGTQTQGGVKVDETNKNQLIYEESKKKLTGITLGEATFANGGTVRTFDNTYDATTATLNADGLKFTEASQKLMETGNTMTMVDASAAIKDASGAALATFNGGAGKSYGPIAFTDTITGKNVTFAGTHTDTLTQDTAKTKLTYTVGDKVVSTATLNGAINWSDNGVHYTNGSDANQNGVAASYKFDGNSAVDVSGVSFSATTDPLNKSMTLLKGVNGVAANKVSGTPSFAVTLDQTNTKLDAKATGAATVSGNDVTYTVSGVAIDKVNIKSVGSTEDTVPANWTLASGASVETDSMTVPSGMYPGEKKAIITATGMDYFNGIAINGSHVWKLDGGALDATPENGVAVAGTQTQSGVKVDETNKKQLVYEETKKKLTSITLGEATFANGGTARTFDNTYDATEAAINAAGLKFTEASSATIETGNTMTIVDASAAIKDSSGAALVPFADKTYNVAFNESNTEKNVTVAGTHTDTLSQDAAKTKLTYTVGTKDVKTVDIGQVDFVKGSTLFNRSGAGYNYAGVAALGTSGFAVAYASPETVTIGDSMTLLQANATLADMAAQAKETVYSYAPVTGVTIDAKVTGNLEAKGGAVTYTAAANQASKLTFGSVPWTDDGVLMTRPANITFAGADVDTSKIGFNNISLLDANKQMTLVSDFGSTVGTITGTKYMIGTTNEGEGSASLEKGNLIFKTKTGAGGAAEQTHRTVMATEAGMATLATGQDFVDSAVEGLGLPTNISPDGTATYAATGGGKNRYKTGSHVDTRAWNAVVAVGSKREHKKGDLEWGVFAEYGRGSYTLHNDDGGRGDGDTHYAGGGLLVKWTNKHNVYTEASVRMGRISDSANNMLQDGAGNQYGYNVHANYYGGHLGVGKIYKLKGHRDLDVYGKFFYTRRNGVSFNAAGRYDLDAVSSSLLRVGARYGTNDKKWNWYGGLAFEYQFDGEAKGMLNGITPIRSASIKGASVRGEIGIRMDATKTNPWKTDISIFGYGGRHRGIGGNISVAYMF